VLAGIGMMVAVAGTGLLVARPGRGAAPRSVAATEPSPGLALAADLASRRRVSLIAISAFLLPTVAVPLLMIIGRAYAPRFVTLATPFLAALLGVAATAVPRRAAVAAGVVIAGVSLAFLSPAYAGYMRSDYGAAMAALRAHVQPDDAIVLNGPWQDLLYRRYGWGLPDRYIIASTVPLIPAESIGWLERLTSSHSRLWVVDSATDAADPTGVVTGWLDAHAYPAPVFQFEKAVLRPYLVSETDPLRERVVDASTLDLRIRSVASDRWAARPGDWARLRIRGTTVVAGDGDALQGASDTGGGDRLFVELDGPDGTDVWHWDGPLEARAGETEYRAAIVVPEGAATGAYTLSAVAYQQGRSGQVVRIGDSVALTTIDVRR
ncbi:MAG TPA: hypothetical protein VFC51_01045, partial [Chloroflexota bacterium]|nr:hypothetical protein [Chloroflexota bacterium]